MSVMSLPLIDTRAAGVRDGWVNTPVTPYKGQKYQNIKKSLLAKGELFLDPEFPSNNKSLFYSKIDHDITWMRPAEMCKVPRFFLDGMKCDDLEHGEHGNSWFVSACASLSTDRKLWRRVVMRPNEQEFDDQYAGIFHFQMWRLGRWFDVVVDDLLPVKDGKLVFCRSQTRYEFWCPLLEKAYAKLYGDYESLRMCRLTDALVDFTGGVAETRMITDAHRHDIYHKEKLLNGLFKALDNKSLVNCEIQCKPSEMGGEYSAGLRKGQPYGITDIKEVNIHKTANDTNGTKTVYLIRLSNPQRNGEWTGAWATTSQEWTNLPAKDRQSMGLTFMNESEFWMSFDEFVSNFTIITHCHFMNTSLFSTKKRYSEGLVYGEWTTGVMGSSRDRSGGCFTQPTFLRNPQYVMDVADEQDTLTVCLQQDDVSLTRRIGAQSTHIGFYIMKVEDNRSYRVHVPGKKMAESVYEPVREIYMRVQLNRGRYVIIPTTWENELTGRFLLRIYTSSSLNLRPLNEEFPVARSCMKPYAIGTLLHVLKVTGMQPKDKIALNPYLLIKCESETVKSPNMKDSNEPTFNINVIFYRKQPALKPITIEVYNCNTLLDDLIGTATLEGNGPETFTQEEIPLYGKAQKAVAPPEVGKVSLEWMSNESFSEL